MLCQLGKRLSCVTKRPQNIVHQGREKFTSLIQKPRSEHLGCRVALDLSNANLGTKILPSYWSPIRWGLSLSAFHLWAFPGGARGKETACQCRRHKRLRFDPWVRKIPWRRAWQSTPVSLPGESHKQRSLAGYSPWGSKESDTTEVIQHIHVALYTSRWSRNEETQRTWAAGHSRLQRRLGNVVSARVTLCEMGRTGRETPAICHRCQSLSFCTTGTVDGSNPDHTEYQCWKLLIPGLLLLKAHSSFSWWPPWWTGRGCNVWSLREKMFHPEHSHLCSTGSGCLWCMTSCWLSRRECWDRLVMSALA